MNRHKAKKSGHGLQLRTFTGRDGATYLVFQTPQGGFNVFVETDAKEAAMKSGSVLSRTKNTRQHWQSVWEAAS
jgi:hypothetical protein